MTGSRAAAGQTITSSDSAGPRSRPHAPSHAARRDIQGLRAVAVVSVIANHLFDWPRGGFVGVDVFFVISGFLITGLLLREHDRTGTISFRGFYVRRFKRLLPAGMLTLVVTVLLARLLLVRQRSQDVFWDGVWSGGFVGNWRFVRKSTDYFAQGALPSPLQHFWSLGVEEQFYLVWPWVLLLALSIGLRGVSRRTRRFDTGLLTLTALLVVASFAYSMVQTSHNPGGAYFDTLSRSWELGVGAFCAVLAARVGRIPLAVRTTVSVAAIAVIVVSMFVIGPTSPFPGPWAAQPVLATAAALLAGVGGRAANALLTNRVSNYVGNISYSLYLWHFPVVILLLALVPGDSVGYYVLALALLVGVSIASYNLVERPVRDSSWLTGTGSATRRPTLIAVAAAAVTVLVLVTGIVASHRPGPTPPAVVAGGACFGAAARVSDDPCPPVSDDDVVPSLDQVGLDTGGAYRCWAGLGATVMRSCPYGARTPGAKRVALVGDSHAASLIPGLARTAKDAGWRLDTYVGNGCQWRLSTDTCATALQGLQQKFVTGRAYDLILTTSDRQFQTPAKTRQAEAAWRPVLQRGTRVVVLADNPTASADTLECLQRVTGRLADCAEPRVDAFAHPDLQAAAAGDVSGVRVVDPTFAYCTSTACQAVVGGVIVYRDTYGHITATWSRTVAPIIVRDVQRQTA